MFWRTIRTNGAGPSNTAFSFLQYKHLVPKYTHNGSLYSAKIPSAWVHYKKDCPWFEEETAHRTSICCWMIHLCSGTCQGSSTDSQLLPLLEKICCSSFSWMFGFWMFGLTFFGHLFYGQPFGLWISPSTNVEKYYIHSQFEIVCVKLWVVPCVFWLLY